MWLFSSQEFKKFNLKHFKFGIKPENCPNKCAMQQNPVPRFKLDLSEL
jgi:hypothetical protein